MPSATPGFRPSREAPGTAHQPDEKVRVSDMVLSTGVYAGFACNYKG